MILGSLAQLSSNTRKESKVKALLGNIKEQNVNSIRDKKISCEDVAQEYPVTRGVRPVLADKEQTDNPVREKKISFEKVAQEYLVTDGVRPVLSDISFDISANDSVAIIGPTGAGKSTLLRLLAGFEAPAAGQVSLWSGAVRKPAAPSSSIGYLFQQPALFPWMTVHENVLFGAKHSHTYGDDKVLMLEQAAYYMARVGLTDASKLYPYQISGGMRARTALARVFLTRPEVLLMDESFGALDALTRRDMYVLLRDLVASSPELTTVMVTHDVDEAITLCGTIMILSGTPGRISAIYKSDLAHRRESVDELQRENDYVELKAALLESLSKRKNQKRID